jgi:hypothetical protein
MGPANFDLLIGTMELITERMMLSGPNDFAAPALQARGWDPLAAKKIADERATQEQQFQDGLSDENRRQPDRLHDIILAREVLVELKYVLKEALATRGCGIPDVLGENKTIPTSLPTTPGLGREVNCLIAYDIRRSTALWSTACTMGIVSRRARSSVPCRQT